MSNHQPQITENQDKEPKASLQLHKSKAILAMQAASRRLQLRCCVVREKRIFGQGIREIANRHEIGLNDVLDLLEEQSADDVRQAHLRGYRDGQIAAKFAPLPLVRDRRVA